MTSTNYYYADGLSSDRVVTQFLEPDDWKEWSRFYDVKDIDRFSPDFGQEKREMKARKWVEHQIKRYESETYGMQWILDKKTGNKLGQCGLLLQDMDGVLELEITYHIYREHWGQGYATEAAQLFRDFGFKTRPVRSIISLVDPRNFASQRVAEHIGMTRGAFRKWKGIELYVYRITRDEWETLQS